MQYDFTTYPDRKGTNSYKWDTLPEKDLISVWVADMDFVCAPQIQSALRERVAHAVYGYTFMGDEDYGAIQEWIQARHGYEARREWLLPCLGVVCAMNAAVDALTPPGGKVVILPPVYPPFFLSGRRSELLKCPLVIEDGIYRIDYPALEESFHDGASTLLLCNPHNPVGRAWTFDELERLGALCGQYDVNVISDDIHCDLILPGNRYTSVLKVDSLKDRSIVLTAATKTFNIAGLQAATAIIPNAQWKEKVSSRLKRYGHSEPNVLAIAAQTAAYQHCAGWVDELMLTIRGNIELLLDALQETPIKSYMPESTYLMWLDCRGMDMNDGALMDFFIKKCRIYPNSGKPFGAEGFVRMNVAVPPKIMREVAANIKKAF